MSEEAIRKAEKKWFYQSFDDDLLEKMQKYGLIAQAEGFSISVMADLEVEMEEAFKSELAALREELDDYKKTTVLFDKCNFTGLNDDGSGPLVFLDGKIRGVRMIGWRCIGPRGYDPVESDTRIGAAFDIIDLQQRLAAAEHRNAELQKDKDRLDALEANFWDIRHSSHPIADTGDSSSSLEIIGHWMDKPFERVIGENYNEDLRAAIDQAMTAPAYPPERPEYPEFDELSRPTESGASE